MPARPPPTVYAAPAALHHALRRFLAFSAAAARAAGLTPRQHQALLAVKGYTRRGRITIAALAARLQLQHNSAVGLVDRLMRAGYIRRSASAADRRRVELRLTARGERTIAQLSLAHLRELRALGPELRRLISSTAAPRRNPATARLKSGAGRPEPVTQASCVSCLWN